MKLWSNRKFEKINRNLHRDLGYLFIGLTLIYGISGIAVILRHIDINIVYNETKIEKQLPANLSQKELFSYWSEQKERLPRLSRVRPTPKDKNMYAVRVKKGTGFYYKDSGKLKLSVYRTNKLVKFVNDIHYNVGGKFTWLGLTYAGMLIFFAISGAIIVKGRNSFMRRGIWFMLVGIGVPVVVYFFI